MTKIWMAAVLAGSLILAGCGGDKPAETAGTEASSPAARRPPAVPDEANGGMITGKVAFTGEKPRMPVLDMSANPACERAHKGVEPESEEVIVNRNGTLKNVFVWVKSGLHPNEDILQGAVAVDNHLFALGLHALVGTLASRVGRHVEYRHPRLLAGERYLTGDHAAVGFVGYGRRSAGRRGGCLRAGSLRRLIAAAARQYQAAGQNRCHPDLRHFPIILLELTGPRKCRN